MMPAARTYFEEFTKGPGGWSSWGVLPKGAKPLPNGNPGTGPLELKIVDGAGADTGSALLMSSSPWCRIAWAHSKLYNYQAATLLHIIVQSCRARPAYAHRCLPRV